MAEFRFVCECRRGGAIHGKARVFKETVEDGGQLGPGHYAVAAEAAVFVALGNAFGLCPGGGLFVPAAFASAKGTAFAWVLSLLMR